MHQPQSRSRTVRFAACLLSCLVVSSCQQSAREDGPERLASVPAAHAGIDNLHEVVPGLWSGSIPEGDAGFDTLEALGIKTVIAVDATVPQLDRLHARGMRSIHLPTVYSGIDLDTRLALARAVRDAEGPVYVHCHHGKHRGPAAAATAAVALGKLSEPDGQAFLRLAGTSHDYPGLFACVTEAAGIDAASIDAWDGELVEVKMVGGMAGAMAEVDDHFSVLDHLAESDWATSPLHPNHTAISEAGSLHDAMRRAVEESVALKKPYTAEMIQAALLAEQLEDALRAGASEDAHDAITRLGDACNDCHKANRTVGRQW